MSMERGDRVDATSPSQTRPCASAKVQCAGRSCRLARSRRTARRQCKLSQPLAADAEAFSVVEFQGSDNVFSGDRCGQRVAVAELRSRSRDGSIDIGEQPEAQAVTPVAEQLPSLEVLATAEEEAPRAPEAASKTALEPVDVTNETDCESREVVASPRCAAIFSQPSKGEDDQLVHALSSLLQHMASLKPPIRRASCFHSQRVPKVTLSSYASRIQKYFDCSQECYVLCLIYIDRIVKLHPDFEVNDLTCHRLLLTGLLLAVKYNDDVFAANDYYSRVGGISPQEMNSLEVEFLRLLEWKLYVSPSEYSWYAQTLRAVP